MANGERYDLSGSPIEVVADDVAGIIELRVVAEGAMQITLQLTPAEAQEAAEQLQQAAERIQRRGD